MKSAQLQFIPFGCVFGCGDFYELRWALNFLWHTFRRSWVHRRYVGSNSWVGMVCAYACI